MKAEVHFLGQPEIFIDRKKIQITQKKVEAMLLYILFNGRCSREELTAVFWCDCDEESARRNLRNSLYKIRNLIGKDFLQTSGKSYISLNQELEIERDIDLFITENSEKKIVGLSSLCFLDKFYLKHCPEFEEWVRSIQNTYERILIDKLQPAMRASFKKGDNAQAVKYAESILKVDPHNEESAYILMKVCECSGEYNRAVLAYNRFTSQLYQDMGLEPGKQIKEEYEHVLRMKNEQGQSVQQGPFYAGHIRAFSALREEYSKFRQKVPYDACIICAGEGMDKEEILWKFEKECENETLIKIWFQNLNQFVEYYAIRRILLEIAESVQIPVYEILEPVTGENADLYFMNASRRLEKKMQSSKKRCVLILHNLEFVDTKSMNLILTCLLGPMRERIFVAASFCANFKMKFPAYSMGNTFPGIRAIVLLPLKEGECFRYVKECLLDGIAINQEERELYRYTGGNLALLREVASNLAAGVKHIYDAGPKTEQLFKRLLHGLSSQEYEYLEYLAIMENGAEADALSSMLHETPAQVVKQLDHLMKSGLLEEINQKGHERLKIQAKMLRDMIYREISNFKRNELHKMALRHYETVCQKTKKDLFILSELKYHSTGSDRIWDALYYDIYYLRYVLDYYDEFFPVVPHDVEILQSFTIPRKEIYEALDAFQVCLNMLEDEIEPARFYELQMELYYLKGRTLNRDGKREEGLCYAQALIDMAQKTENKKMLLNGYIEALCYGVKAEDPSLMRHYLERMKGIGELTAFQAEKGTILRLEGYCRILEKDYKGAEILLKESIEIFSSPKLSNTNYYSAAGAYDYLAITYRCQNQFEKAREAIEQAIRLCTGKGTGKGLDLFYCDYGYILFLQGKYKEAEKYFVLSARIYDDFGTYWLRSVGESCMAVIHLERGEEKEALEHFRRAEIFSRKEKTREELEILEDARRRLKQAKVLI